MPSPTTNNGLSQMGGEAPVEMNPSRKFLVQDFTPLSESVMWDLLANYYKKMALEAWSDNYVPMFVTSNSRFAKSYAKVVFAFLKDWYKSPKSDPQQPVYIIEVGGGHGRFSFLFLRHLLRTQPLWKSCNIPERPFVYVFSDVASANVEFCSKHKALQQFIQDGWLDFALFDANLTTDFTKRIHLKVKNTEIPQGSPMVVISNYVLDSLLTDAYKIDNENGVRHFSRSRVAIYSNQVESDPTNPDIISRMTVNWDWERFEFPSTTTTTSQVSEGATRGPLTEGGSEQEAEDEQQPLLSARPIEEVNPLKFLEPTVSEGAFLKGLVAERKKQLKNHVEVERRKSVDSSGTRELEKPLAPAPEYLKNNTKIQAVLRQYAEQAEDLPGYSTISFVLPFGAFMLFEYLNHYSNGNLLALIGDKGYSDSDEFRGDRTPHIAIHGSISFMVNIHSIKQYFSAMGGFYACTPYKDTFQVTFCYSFNSLNSQSFGESLSHLLEDLEDLPPDSLIAWQRTVQESSAAENVPSLKTLISLLRYSAHDPEVFFNLRKELSSQCVSPFLGPRGESDLQKDLERVFEHWYKLRKNEDVPDILAQLSMKTGRLDRALFFFQQSLDWCPEARHVATLANMAACFKAIGRLDEALETIKTALDESPRFQPALDLKTQIEMCRHRTSLALIGSGRYIRDEAMPLIIRDGRTTVKGIFAFQQHDAEALADQLKLGESCVAYSGSSGLSDLLNRSDIDACIVDVHPGIFPSIATKIWNAGKHLLTKAPISLSSQIAHETIYKFLEFNKSPSVVTKSKHSVNRVAWHVVRPAKYEEAFQEVSKTISAGELGQVQNVNYRFTTDGDTKQGYDPATTLAIDLLQGISALRCILDSELSSIGATLSNSSSVLAGWFRLNLLNSHNNNNNNNMDNSSHQLIPGSFICCRQAGDKLNQIDLRCEKGSIKLKKVASSWKVTTKFDVSSIAPPREKAYPISGVGDCHDKWFQQLYHHQSSSPSSSTTTTQTPSSEEDLGQPLQRPPTPQMMGKLHSSVYATVTDSSVVEAVIISSKNNGCAMELGVVKSDNIVKNGSKTHQ